MNKAMIILAVVFLFGLSVANAISQEEIAEAKTLVNSKVDCKDMSDSQLEIIGEYYMEQMHPTESHELMHKMMGLKEGSSQEEKFHISMAQRLYCNEGNVGYGMMGSGGMMNMMGAGMMGVYPYGHGLGSYGPWNALGTLFWMGIAVFICWLIYKFAIKGKQNSDTPLSILRKRFAKGELTKKEFGMMKKDLGE